MQPDSKPQITKQILRTKTLTSHRTHNKFLSLFPTKRRKEEIIRKSRGFVSQCQCYVFQYLDTGSGLRDSVDIVVVGKLTEIRQTPTQIVLCCQQLCRYCVHWSSVCIRLEIITIFCVSVWRIYTTQQWMKTRYYVSTLLWVDMCDYNINRYMIYCGYFFHYLFSAGRLTIHPRADISIRAAICDHE